MNPDFTEEMHKLLLEARQLTLRNLASESEQLREAIKESGSGDLVDLATSGIDASLLETVGIRELTKLKMLESALVRVDNDSYGQCVRCAGEIQAARLRAMPYAPFCISCQNRSEQKKRKK